MKTTTTKKATKKVSSEKKAPRFTVSDLMATIKSGAEQLRTEIAGGISDHYKEYLQYAASFASSFHKYSANNTLLIIAECKHRGLGIPRYFTNYHKWQSMGFQVQSGQKGIPILVPAFFVKEAEKEDEEDKLIRLFKVGYIFTDAQVEVVPEGQKHYKEGAKLPDFFPQLVGNADDLFSHLLAVVQADGIKVQTVAIPGATRGRSFGKKIELDNKLDSVSRLLVLIHEYAHELLHWDGVERSKQVEECHAEAVAYVVANALGINDPYAADYLQNWGNDEKSFLKELKVITETAQNILIKMSQQMGITEKEEEETELVAA